MGEAILRACEPEPRAASRESLFASLKIFPPKKIKNGQNALIWYLLHAGCFHYAKPTGKRPVEIPEENGTTIKPGQPRGMASNRNGPFHLTFERNFRNLWHNRKHKVMESFPLFFYFYQLSWSYRTNMFPILLLNYQIRGKRKCRDSVTFLRDL